MNQPLSAPDRGILIQVKADQLVAEGRSGVTFEEAEDIGMHPTVQPNGDWAVSADYVIELGTAIETSAIVVEAEQREIEAADPELQALRKPGRFIDTPPSFHGLTRRPKPYGQVTTDQPAFDLSRRARR